MPNGTKIATCCYCGTRAALVLKGSNRHELSCSGCGAPLHDMKWLKKPASEPRQYSGGPKSSVPMMDQGWGGSGKKRKKKRKSRAKWFLKEAVDLIEDIFD